MKKNWIKYIIAFLTVFVVRLIPFRAPNVEPIMATVMPTGKNYGGLAAFFFSASSIALYDIFTSGWGIWTLITALIYGLIGFGSWFYFKNRSGWKNYALYAIVFTLVYDALTGLTLAPIFFGLPFKLALVGQIPFTLLHLISNTAFAIVLSPMIEKWMVSERKVVASYRESVRIS